jgi:two-component system phosphate regulon sensor histidine kinase PhoR
MKSKNQTYLIYLVGLTILVTIGIQLFWNQQNYLMNQQQIMREVQDGLDQSVSYYYEETSQNNYITLIDTTSRIETGNGSSTLKLFEVYADLLEGMDNITDPLSTSSDKKMDDLRAKNAGVVILRGRAAATKRPDLEAYPNRITVDVNPDSLQFEILKKYIDIELNNRNIQTTYILNHLKNDTVYAQFGMLSEPDRYLKSVSGSLLIPKNEALEFLYVNPAKSIYRKGLLGILLSLVLSAGILFCLLYLLRVIRKQKELSVIKNDFMSNITHELKTPISTAMTALEGISGFNKENDPVKTEKYLEISRQQMTKLNSMVEKILDTASLDSDRLPLSLEKTDVILLLKKVTEKFRGSYPQVRIELEAAIPYFTVALDPFHFENAINNLIDNACKYGDKQVNIKADGSKDFLDITISDNGPGIPKKFREQIFEKFFRIPQGNRHDVKGFGIGLYYARNILLKHGFSLILEPEDSRTTFRVNIRRLT